MMHLVRDMCPKYRRQSIDGAVRKVFTEELRMQEGCREVIHVRGAHSMQRKHLQALNGLAYSRKYN